MKRVGILVMVGILVLAITGSSWAALTIRTDFNDINSFGKLRITKKSTSNFLGSVEMISDRTNYLIGYRAKLRVSQLNTSSDVMMGLSDLDSGEYEKKYLIKHIHKIDYHDLRCQLEAAHKYLNEYDFSYKAFLGYKMNKSLDLVFPMVGISQDEEFFIGVQFEL